MIKKTSSNQPCGRDSEYITGAFLKSLSIYYTCEADLSVLKLSTRTCLSQNQIKCVSDEVQGYMEYFCITIMDGTCIYSFCVKVPAYTVFNQLSEIR